MREPLLRRADPADVEQLIGLVQRFHAEDGHAFDEAVVNRALRRLLDQPQRGELWVLEDETNAIVGYFVLGYGYSIEFHGVDAFLDELYLEPALRGRGWGSLLLSKAEEVAKRAGVRALHLEVTRANQHAAMIYERRGYRDHNRTLMTKWL
ncbi:MAG TPA: GNAT family N-acetyltransferase [Bryobacteraceae bacterium]|nr:GNAT family N-acetyltransferase [Bryobacteraceae bacterium]